MPKKLENMKELRDLEVKRVVYLPKSETLMCEYEIIAADGSVMYSEVAHEALKGQQSETLTLAEAQEKAEKIAEKDAKKKYGK